MYDDPAAEPLERGPSLPPAPAIPSTPSARATVHPGDGDSDRLDPRICPFLRAADDGGRLDAPYQVPHPVNRCAALGEPVPQSLRQQELVCLSSGHVNCPRYLRGSVDSPVPVRVPVARPVELTPAITGALAVLVLAFVLSVGFVVANGGIALTSVANPTPSGQVLGEVETAPPEPTPIVTPAPTVPPTAAPAPTSSPRATPSPTVAPTPAPTPGATAAATPKPRPTSNRYALLDPCPNRSGCWIYHIRSGDNLYSIARYFGVSLATVRAWNTWTQDGLKVGRELRIPTPTR